MFCHGLPGPRPFSHPPPLEASTAMTPTTAKAAPSLLLFLAAALLAQIAEGLGKQTPSFAGHFDQFPPSLSLELSTPLVSEVLSSAGKSGDFCTVVVLGPQGRIPLPPGVPRANLQRRPAGPALAALKRVSGCFGVVGFNTSAAEVMAATHPLMDKVTLLVRPSGAPPPPPSALAGSNGQVFWSSIPPEGGEVEKDNSFPRLATSSFLHLFDL